MRERAKKYLCKGVRKNRFREGKVKYPVLYGIAKLRYIKLSELAEEVGVHKTTPRRWVAGEYNPKEENKERVGRILNAKTIYLFMEYDIEKIRPKNRPQNTKLRCNEYSKITYPILYSLVLCSGHTVRTLSEETGISANTISGYFYKDVNPLNPRSYRITKKNVKILEEYFGIHRETLFTTKQEFEQNTRVR